MTGLREAKETFHEYLKSGIALCELVNVSWKPALSLPLCRCCWHPHFSSLNAVLCVVCEQKLSANAAKLQRSTQRFRQMENIDNFLKAARALGVREFDLFATIDLYEQKNLKQVVQCLLKVSRSAPFERSGGILV